jgi:hypothetical protein
VSGIVDGKDTNIKDTWANIIICFLKKIYINGLLLNQREPVLPEVTRMEFGIDSTTHPKLIRQKLEEIRLVEID